MEEKADLHNDKTNGLMSIQNTYGLILTDSYGNENGMETQTKRTLDIPLELKKTTSRKLP